MWPEQRRTGSRGYLGNCGLVSESLQNINVEPFADWMTFAFTQSAQRPNSCCSIRFQLGLGGVAGAAGAGGVAGVVESSGEGGGLGRVKCDSLMLTFTSILSARILCDWPVAGVVDSIRKG